MNLTEKQKKNSYSTVTECVLNDHIYRDGVLIYSNTTYWRFDIIITTSRLSKIFHYSETQKQVFKIVKHQKEKYNYSFKRISDCLNDNNFSTVRSKRKFKTNDVFSVYKRGLEREGKINKSHDLRVENVRFYYL